MLAAAYKELSYAIERVLPIGVRALTFGSPGPLHWPGDAQLLLHLVVVWLQVLVADRPVVRYPVQGPYHEVALVHPQRYHAVMDGAAPNPLAGDVGTQLDGVVARRHAGVGPVELIRALLIRDEIALRHPVWPRLEHHHPEPRLGQLLAEHP